MCEESEEDHAFTCPDCGTAFTDHNTDEGIQSFGGMICPECGHTGLEEDF